MSFGLARRSFLAGTVALAGCGKAPKTAEAQTPTPREGPLPRLRDLAPFPIGTQIVTDQFAFPVVEELAKTQFSQITTGYELKMEYVLQPDGTLRFDGADRIAAFCRQNGQRLHAHTLVWYSEKPQAFQKLDGDAAAFGRAYDAYVDALVSRYAGKARGWDVINEPVNTDGEGLRDSLWVKNLGQEGHFIRAFERARQADPEAVLFVNDYDLESNPKKRRTFLNLVESMLKRGVPITGIGNQSHVRVDLPTGAITTALNDLASLGLPVHMSEFDCSLQSHRGDLRGRPAREQAQVALYREAVEAYKALPRAQQYAFTIWGVRDTESWVRMAYYGGDKTDAPTCFDDNGQPKAPFWAVVDALKA